MCGEMEKSALIAMSGGVDSSAAARLMLEAGYRCMGGTMRLFCPGGEVSAAQQRDAEDARAVAAQLGIPFEVMDFQAEFRAHVIEKFVRVYETGGTPNPCIDCNRHLKFGALLRAAEERGLSCVATGHYARVERDEASGRWLLKKALDPGKDQSYVLYSLTQEQLARVRFPLGSLTKAQVRALAEQLGFVNAHRQESQDICFVPDGDYVGFMERFTGKTYPEGDYLNLAGEPVGRHRGAVRYTLGQRKGLHLAMGTPVYVCGKSMDDNTVTVGPEEALYASTVLVEEVNWIPFPRLEAPMRLKAKTRYRQQEQWAVIRPEGADGARLEFEQPQRAVTPGQAAVFYDGNLVVGGGTISAVLP